MASIYMKFPGGISRALTLSYDDGVEQDIKLIEILDRYGLKATFNLNSGAYASEDKVFEPGRIHRRLSKSRIDALYPATNHEIALHAYTHPHLEELSDVNVVDEVLTDRKTMEAQFGRIVRGMAYPYGTYNDNVVECLRRCGVAYARTTVSTEKFTVPTDWLRMPATCHHNNPRLMELADKFINIKIPEPKLFYLWGHSYEFESNNNWDVIENFAAFMGGRDNIWYATNIEIYNYVTAYRNLIFSADASLVYNPSALTVWFSKNSKVFSVAPGETLRI